ncbi:MAG: hypothetical protein J3Q66DRAFT_374736 [Benniella sp.]|nr:MAG: hypothetical protein J3Q66DRAFT_374736 [Benniella sp.]
MKDQILRITIHLVQEANDDGPSALHSTWRTQVTVTTVPTLWRSSLGDIIQDETTVVGKSMTEALKAKKTLIRHDAWNATKATLSREDIPTLKRKSEPTPKLSEP